jgi:hypothetical protein
MGELSYYGDNNLFGSIVANNMGLASLMIVTIIVMLCGWFFLQRKTKASLPLGRLGFPFIRDTLEFMTTLQNNNTLTFSILMLPKMERYINTKT